MPEIPSEMTVNINIGIDERSNMVINDLFRLDMRNKGHYARLFIEDQEHNNSDWEVMFSEDSYKRFIKKEYDRLFQPKKPTI